MVKVNIHLGAHKTATTSLQAILRKNSKFLSDHNVFYYPREEFREEVTRPYFYPKKMGGEEASLLDKLKTNGQYSGEDKVVISEENLMALVQEIFIDNEFYPYSPERLLKLKRFLKDVKVESVFFTVRNYTDFISSVYTQINKSLRFTPFGVFRKSFGGQSFSWFDIVRVISETFPEAKVFVARFEDMIKVPSSYYSELIFGLPYENLVGLDARLNEGVSAEAVRCAEYLNSELSVRLKGEEFVNVSKLYPVSLYSKYMPFGDDEKATLTRKYLYDLKGIEEAFGLYI